jgi:hypothetical protein
MKKYLVFFIEDMFCPGGGMHDFKFDTNELEEAEEKIKDFLDNNIDGSAHIYDTYERKMIFDSFDGEKEN